MAVFSVLIAEHDEAQGQILDLLLSSAGLGLNFVADGREALAFLRDNTPDLVVTALDLPVLDGLELSRKVRSVRRLARAPVILLTVDATAAAAAQADARAAGIALVLAAPLGDKNLPQRALALIRESRSPSGPAAGAPKRSLQAPVLAPVSSGVQLDEPTELGRLKKVISDLSQESTSLKRQLTATGRATSGGELISELRGELVATKRLLAAYRNRYPDFETDSAGDAGSSSSRNPFRRKR